MVQRGEFRSQWVVDDQGATGAYERRAGMRAEGCRKPAPGSKDRVDHRVNAVRRPGTHPENTDVSRCGHLDELLGSYLCGAHLLHRGRRPSSHQGGVVVSFSTVDQPPTSAVRRPIQPTAYAKPGRPVLQGPLPLAPA